MTSTSAHHEPKNNLDITALVASGTIKRIVLAALRTQIAAAGADPDDVVQQVLVRLVTAQRSPRSRYDASRGMSPTTYVCMVAKTAGRNALRTPSRLKARESSLSEELEPGSALAAEGEDLLMERVMALLDTDQEKTMASLLSSGWTLSEIRTEMNLTESEASELRTRVRALLLPLREG